MPRSIKTCTQNGQIFTVCLSLISFLHIKINSIDAVPGRIKLQVDLILIALPFKQFTLHRHRLHPQLFKCSSGRNYF